MDKGSLPAGRKERRAEEAGGPERSAFFCTFFNGVVASVLMDLCPLSCVSGDGGAAARQHFLLNLSKIEIRNDQSSRREQPMILVQLTSFRSRREWTMALAAVAVSSLQSLV